MTAYKQTHSTNIEQGCFVYGVASVIVSSIASLVGIGVILYVILNYYINGAYSESDAVLYCLLLSAITAPCVVFLLFSTLLVYGVAKQNHNLVLTFFIFGILSIPLVGGLALYFEFIPGYIIFVAYAIFLLPLILVWKTYRQFKDNGFAKFQNLNKVMYFETPTIKVLG